MMGSMVGERIWTNSGDSHFLEPDDLWHQIMPKSQADRMPRTELIGDSEERVTVDGKSFTRAIPKIATAKGATGETIVEMSHRPPGARDVRLRLLDLDKEGVWAELIFASIGLWCALIEDKALIREAARAENEWMVSEIQGAAPDRLVCAALMPLLDVDDAVAEVHHAADIGMKVVSLPTGNPPGTRNWNDDMWEPLWAACDEASMVVAFHIGTDNVDQSAMFRGPGGAILNYVETGFGGLRVSNMLISGGALDRHPEMKVLIAEGGAAWVPYLGDRMNEAYRQHGTFVRPTMSSLPKEILYRQVYASFQHDESGPAVMTATGYNNLLFGSDYPHLEGTFGHTQKTLHELFDGYEPAIRDRITRGTFQELFPHTAPPPA